MLPGCAVDLMTTFGSRMQPFVHRSNRHESQKCRTITRIGFIDRRGLPMISTRFHDFSGSRQRITCALCLPSKDWPTTVTIVPSESATLPE